MSKNTQGDLQSRYWLTEKGEAAATQAQEAMDRGELEPNQPLKEG